MRVTWDGRSIKKNRVEIPPNSHKKYRTTVKYIMKSVNIQHFLANKKSIRSRVLLIVGPVKLWLYVCKKPYFKYTIFWKFLGPCCLPPSFHYTTNIYSQERKKENQTSCLKISLNWSNLGSIEGKRFLYRCIIFNFVDWNIQNGHHIAFDLFIKRNSFIY